MHPSVVQRQISRTMPSIPARWLILPEYGSVVAVSIAPETAEASEMPELSYFVVTGVGCQALVRAENALRAWEIASESRWGNKFRGKMHVDSVRVAEGETVVTFVDGTRRRGWDSIVSS